MLELVEGYFLLIVPNIFLPNHLSLIVNSIYVMNSRLKIGKSESPSQCYWIFNPSGFICQLLLLMERLFILPNSILCIYSLHYTIDISSFYIIV